ncbi:MAG: undecaprenyldiphospho-muramoylpentapeptide beta-N-acetylglucosaminyltransferase [Candidatus Omnitrophica bacterium]|nr:undecaprenyldiphospho-muramoylpentapeptide beta-N-acetylglucosaminyltransferase [Candidatus Omnitrophota bacterium]
MRILAVAGASGGHIFPAVSFLEAVKDKSREIDTLLVLPRKSIEKQLDLPGCIVSYISISALSLRFNFKNIMAFSGFLLGALQSLFLLLKFRPNVVVGFGSIASVPMVFFARCLGIKTVLHEQNVIPGRANRFLARFADRIAVSFDDTRKYLKSYADKIVLTGNPVRKGLKKIEKKEALGFFEFSADKFTVLVMGGSQGSLSINKAFLKAVSGMRAKDRLQVIHLCGVNDFESVGKSYKELKVNVRLFGFLKSMEYAYSACDLAVSRAGAVTLSELMFLSVPAVVIPYPLAYNHQAKNAEILKNAGCAVIIEDGELGTGILQNTLEEIMEDPRKIEEMRRGFERMPPAKADKLLANNVLGLALN